MRRLAWVVVVTGCMRARATMVHPTGLERTTGGAGPHTTIARRVPQAGEVPQAPETTAPDRVSVELGVHVPVSAPDADARVHLAPGIRLFGAGNPVLWGVAVGADFIGKHRGTGFALEGSVHVGDTTQIEEAMDLFAGLAIHTRRASAVAIGPSVGVLGMPGGHAVVVVGLGVRVAGH